jgi:PAS domain S-box-containing protein
MPDEIRVLYIDDEPVLRKVARVFLEQSGNCSVEPVASALVALDLLKHQKFDAIISDYKMPGMDGIALLKQLRAGGDSTPFIIFTGRGREEVAIEALNSGADFYMQKGGDPKSQFTELAHKVKRAVEQRRVEQALLESEQKYRNLIEHSNEAIVVAQGDLLRLINRRATELTGYSKEEMLSIPFSAFIHPEDRPKVMEQYAKRFTSGEIPSRYSFRVVAKDGAVRWVEINIVMIDWEGSPATLNFLTDVTERKQAEDALRIQHDLSLVLNHCTSLTDAFDQSLSASLQIEGLDAGGIYMADPLTGALDIVVHRGLSPGFVASASHYDAKSPQAQRCHIGTPFYGRYSEIRPPDKDGSRDKEQLTAIASIPVMHGGELISVLNVASHSADEIPVSARHILETMAMQVATALVRIRSREALEESETRYRNVVEDQTEFICRFLPDGTHVFVNEAYCRYFGISREDIIGSRFSPDLLPEDREMVARTLSSLTPEHPVETIEQCIIMPDGNTRWQRWVDRAIFDPGGNLKEFQSVGRDITELKEREIALKIKNEELRSSYEQIAIDEEKLRHQVEEITAAQQAYRESEEKFRLVVENAPDAIVIQTNGRFVYLNPAACHLFGTISAEQLIGEKVLDVFHPGIRERVRERIRMLNEERQPVARIEVALLKLDGTLVDAEISAVPVTYENKNGAMAFIRDITERKRAERELRETERRMEDIINFLPDATFAIDYEGRVIAWNHAIEEMTGIRAEDMLGKGNYEYAIPFYGERRPILIDLVMMQDQRVINDYSAVQKDGDALTAETNRARVGGKDVCLWGKSILFKNPDGKVVGAIESIRDITDRKMVEIDLEKSRNLYRAIFETTGAATIIIDRDTTIVLANSGFAKLSGYTINDLEGKKSWTEFVVDEDLELMKRYHHDRRDDPSGTPNVYEFRFVDRNGKVRYCLNNVGIIPGSTRSIASVVDITGLKMAETALRETLDQLTQNELDLRESEEKYRTVFENTGTATVVLDDDGIIELANNGFAQLSGFPKDEIEGKKKWTEFVIPEDLDRMRTQHQLRRQDRQKALKRYEFRFVPKTGDIRYIFLFIDIIPGTKKSIASLLDITSRIQAEELYQTVFENTGTAMFIVEENSVISHVNDQMEKVWGYTKEEIEGRVKWHSLVAEEDLGKMKKYHQMRWKDPGLAPKDYEFRFIHKNGEIRDGALSVAVIPGTKRSVVSLRDITELKKLDRQVKERTEQVELLLRQKDEFIAQAGHDLKTPLTPIIALLPHIYKKEQDPELRSLLEMVISDAAAMKHLITDILTLAELNRPYTRPDAKLMVLADEVEKGIQKHAWMARKKGNIIENSVAPEMRIWITPLHLESIIDNLLGNAIRYTPEGGTITISSKSTEGAVIISVADTGIGLTPEETVRIFDEFYKADMSRHQRDSSGLGLTIVNRIARLYGGSVKAESQGKGCGSTFTVTLPQGS